MQERSQNGYKSSSNLHNCGKSGSDRTLNDLLHEAGNYIIGRMGIPYREKGINIISIAIDAPQDMISSLSGKIGRLKGVSAKTAYSNIITKAEAHND